jgi:hypothetical protein
MDYLFTATGVERYTLVTWNPVLFYAMNCTRPKIENTIGVEVRSGY